MRKIFYLIFIVSLIFQSACQRGIFQSPTAVAPASLRDVPALRLNFRFEADVPAPPAAGNENAQTEERNAAVQNDFDQNRPQEILEKTLASPDKQRVLAVYRKADDAPAEFRLDMYAADGKILRRITYDGMAVYFPETIVWSPDSKTVAFMAKVRTGQGIQPTLVQPNQNGNQANTAAANSRTNTETDSNANVENTNSAPINPTPQIEPPKAVLTLRTQQIYICGADGEDVKLLTQNEGLIYFYFVWSPDSSMLAALASTYQEWQILQYQAESKGEFFIPFGRPRLVEKNGRERRLDDYPTSVYPVWSPDSAKIAIAFDKQIRIYDAIGNAPTQAAIPLQNQLLISSKTYKEQMARQEQGENTNAAAPTNDDANANQAMTTTIDEDSMVYFNPIIDLKWTEDKMLYLQTGYVKMYKDSANNVRSYLRWHRLIFSPQAVAIN